MKAQNLGELAAKLGRPAKALSAFARLTPDQVGVLGDAIDAACERQRRTLDTAIEAGWLSRTLLKRLRG